ncbi:MAG: LysM peptidoglycan-binding domain-containing M23 family metallopeptidase [Deltaproteobacteria bacterium]|nr:LysM peptidoglycan-binding domain-containing M23 family metallopeptidase [Deltaproteobacteria bacterium]MBW2416266.1 LysM peptidoglycan-binding domain-containing M23 family metallopeptidase [Deltaproteobacteria bacterium]
MTRAGGLALALALAVGALTACGTPGPDDRPRYHTVKKGETLWRISQDYETTVDALVRANDIRDVTTLPVGTRLFIPPSMRYAPRRSAERYNGSHPKGRASSVRLAWPIQGKLSSRFGIRDQVHHDGIDIKAPRGTAIKAAEAGRVIHSDDSLAGYGNLIIVKHAGNLSTVYAHNDRNLVKVGEFVKKGQVIGEVGRTGRATTHHLHFEVRRDGRPRDPLQYLQ